MTYKYQKIVDEYKYVIHTNKLKSHELLPSEYSLMKRHQVSRTTIRSALNTLVDLGLIYRKQGKGTLVSTPILFQNVASIYAFGEDMVALDHKKVLEY